ncbi:MAG: Ig-like domain-containing protein [Longimicrobiales bacterium]
MNAIRMSLVATALIGALATPTLAQDSASRAGLLVNSLRSDPAEVTMVAGDRVPLTIAAFDANGDVVDAQIRVAGRGVSYEDGFVTASTGGEFSLFAVVVLPADSDRPPVTLRIVIKVAYPSVERIVIQAEAGRLYAGTMIRHGAVALHADGTLRPDAAFTWSSSAPSIASVDGRGVVTAHAAGTVTITAEFEGAEESVRYQIPAFPATSLVIEGGLDQARTGDVLTFEAVARDDGTAQIDDVPVMWSLGFVSDDSINAPGAAGILRTGKFVGEVPGTYTVVASAGDLTAMRVVDVRPRDVVQTMEIMGRGSVNEVHTSDLWIFEGVDGRDYAVTGTWGGDGWAFFWDVTDPMNIVKTDSIQIDARTVNDVKVSPDGRYAALSREGASNRKNGVVILDLADPAHPTIASVYDDDLTGGVHNLFATNDYLFALSAGDKYVILDVTDLRNPTYVSEYNHPNSRIHDVWVYDGVAYSSEWGTGVVVVDVGNGRWGGSIENPVFVTNVPNPVGATHAAFPYSQESTGKFYLFLGDEIMSRGEAAWGGVGTSRIPGKGGTPAANSGYTHIIDFTDPENPEDVARYEVSEFGTHNIWIEDDILYQAYYEGGMRIVDVSGELLGNLATQGREMAVFKSYDPNGLAANAPMVWGGQPYKGHIFFSDFNSGLWSVKITPKTRPVS